MSTLSEPLLKLMAYERETLERLAHLGHGQAGLWLRPRWSAPVARRWIDLVTEAGRIAAPMQAELQQWPIEARCVDRVVLEHVLEESDDLAVWTEAVAALRPGGAISISAFARRRRELPVGGVYPLRRALAACRALGLSVDCIQPIGAAWPWVDCRSRRARWAGRLLPVSAPSYVVHASLVAPLVRRPRLQRRALTEALGVAPVGSGR